MEQDLCLGGSEACYRHRTNSKFSSLDHEATETMLTFEITIPGSIAAQVCVAAFGKEAVKSSFDFNSKMDALNFERDILDDVKLYWKSCHSKFITGVLEAKVRSASTALTNAKDTFNKMSNGKLIGAPACRHAEYCRARVTEPSLGVWTKENAHR